MEIPIYIVDAFSSQPFSGNPAAVCPLKEWLPDATLASIARENNLSETAFFIGEAGNYHLRWFTPAREVDLCGHATLATAFVIANFIEPTLRSFSFTSKSGVLVVKRTEDLYSLDFPSRPGVSSSIPKDLSAGLGLEIRELFLSRDFLAIVDSELEVLNCRPNYSFLQDLPSFGIIVSAPSSHCDFVSRVFFPTDPILEDPVTGSAHCTLIPYWSKRLGKQELHAKQISKRGGDLFCVDRGERVLISGNAVLYSRGSIFLRN